jgi:protein-tyrosine phosphatase
MSSANEIISGLWLGNEESAHDKKFLNKAGITSIVNASKNISCDFSLDHDYYKIPVNDPGVVYSEDQEDQVIMKEHINKVLNWIKNKLMSGEKVLIHCHAGIQRSATVVFCYLYKFIYKKGSIEDRYQKTIERMINNRPVAFFGGKQMSFRPMISNFVREN